MHSDIDRRSGGCDPPSDAVAEKLRGLSAELRPPFGWNELGPRMLRARAEQTARECSATTRWHGAVTAAATRRRPAANLWQASAAAAGVVLLAAAGMVASRHYVRGQVEVVPARTAAGLRAPLGVEARERRARDSATAVSAVAAAVPLERLGARPAASDSGASHSAAGAPASAAVDSTTQQMLTRAAAAERWLASKPESSTVVYVGSRLAVVDLENGIASLDDELNVARVLDGRSAARVRQLQLERAQLVDSLAQVRYAEILADDTQ